MNSTLKPDSVNLEQELERSRREEDQRRSAEFESGRTWRNVFFILFLIALCSTIGALLMANGK